MKNFGKDTYNDEITLKEADDDQNNLLVEIIDFKNKKITRSREKIRKKILKGREKFFMLSRVKNFQQEIQVQFFQILTISEFIK